MFGILQDKLLIKLIHSVERLHIHVTKGELAVSRERKPNEVVTKNC